LRNLVRGIRRKGDVFGGFVDRNSFRLLLLLSVLYLLLSVVRASRMTLDLDEIYT